MSGYDYESKVVSIPDYPEPGVIFKDITPLFSDAEAFQSLVKDIADHFRDAGITKVVGAEARGFMLGAPVALELGAGFVPARKPGKLPRETFSETYSLEYGTDELEMHVDALAPDDRVLVVDAHQRHLPCDGSPCREERRHRRRLWVHPRTRLPEAARGPCREVPLRGLLQPRSGCVTCTVFALILST